jgi:hypothetical protein
MSPAEVLITAILSLAKQGETPIEATETIRPTSRENFLFMQIAYAKEIFSQVLIHYKD